MTFSPEQDALYRALSAGFQGTGAQATDVPERLTGLLDTLLRRQGDGEFKATIGGAFLAAINGKPPPEQARLACEVLRLVIEKRPEIAIAYAAKRAQAAPRPATPIRREADRAVPDIIAQHPEKKPREKALAREEVLAGAEDFPYRQAEHLVADFILRRAAQKLKVFRGAGRPMPTAFYSDSQPFFAFCEDFAPVLRAALDEDIVPRLRYRLIKEVYKPCPVEAVTRDEAKHKAFFAEKNKIIWPELLGLLDRLQGCWASAAGKMEKRRELQEGIEKGPEYKMVEIPVEVPKVYSVFGVSFTFGHETKMKKVRARVRSSIDLEDEEQFAWDVLQAMHVRAHESGLHLPEMLDFKFLRSLLEMDERKFRRSYEEMRNLVRDPETSKTYLFQRLRFLDEAYANTLSDIVLIMLFRDEGDDAFPFSLLYNICIGAAANTSALKRRRPFVQEVVRERPLELARQIGRLMTENASAHDFAVAVRLYSEAVTILSKARFQAEIDASVKYLWSFGAFDEGARPEAFNRITGALATGVMKGTAPEKYLPQVLIGYKNLPKTSKRKPGGT